MNNNKISNENSEQKKNGCDAAVNVLYFHLKANLQVCTNAMRSKVECTQTAREFQ